jgi:hypothetical protein
MFNVADRSSQVITDEAWTLSPGFVLATIFSLPPADISLSGLILEVTPDFFFHVMQPKRLGTKKTELRRRHSMDVPASSMRNREQLTTVRTEHLRERLNRLYDAVRGNVTTYSYWNRFDYLWDLKELAVLEGRNNVQIPEQWLDELEKIYVEVGDFAGRSH